MNLFEQLVLGKTAEEVPSAMTEPQTEEEQIRALVDELDMNDLSNEELLELAEQARAQELQLTDEDDEGMEEMDAGAKTASVADYEQYGEALKQANAFLGRVRAHAFWDELEKISQSDDFSEEKKDEKKKDKKKKEEMESEKEASSKFAEALRIISEGL
jgi:hypothetical protein